MSRLLHRFGVKYLYEQLLCAKTERTHKDERVLAGHARTRAQRETADGEQVRPRRERARSGHVARHRPILRRNGGLSHRPRRGPALTAVPLPRKTYFDKIHLINNMQNSIFLVL